MLTDRGWAALGVGVALIVLWVALGEIELLAASVVILAAVAVAIVVVRLARPNVSVVRRLTPNLVHEGDRATVQTAISNEGRGPLLSASLSDDVGALGNAVFEVGALRAGQSADADYQILCKPRGIYPVGPLTVRVSDPIGLASASTVTEGADRLIVFPAVEDLVGFPMTRGRDPAMQASRPEFSHRGGEDFYTLREYVTGDDLRRVHWPTSAKKDELMIRQLETPWQSRALVILDIRDNAYENADCFEKAVRGAASVVRHLAHTGFDADLWAGGTDATSVNHYTAAMERLASVERESRLDIRAVAARLNRVGRGGALILVTGVPDHELLEAQRLMAREYRTTLVMSAAETVSTSELAFQRSGAVTISVRPDDSWAVAWNRATNRTWLGASAG